MRRRSLVRANGSPAPARSTFPSLAGLVFLGAGLAGACLAGAASGEGTVEGQDLHAAGVWMACDALDPARGFPSGAGLWGAIGFRSWESLPEGGEAEARAGYEPRNGIGLDVGARRLEGGAARYAREWSAALVLRSDHFRVSGRLCDAAFGGAGQRTLRGRILVKLHPAVLLGVAAEAIPGAERGAVAAVPEVRLRGGPWLAALAVSDSPELSLGVVANARWVVFVRVAGGIPAAGVGFLAAPVAFQAEAGDHPFLGRTARVALRAGGVP